MHNTTVAEAEAKAHVQAGNNQAAWISLFARLQANEITLEEYRLAAKALEEAIDGHR